MARAKELLRDDQKALEDLVNERYVARTISEEHYAKARTALEARITDTQATIERLSRPQPTIDLSPEHIARTWTEFTIDERRDLMKAEIDKVLVHPAARKGGNKFDANRVQVCWAA